MEVDTRTYFAAKPAKPVWNPLDYVEDDVFEASGRDPFEGALTLVQAELKKYGMESLYQKDIKSYGMEVGDDRVELSNTPDLIALQFVVQESIMKMKTSIKDTFISNEAWNFCEVTSRLPRAVEESFDYARKTDMTHLGFVDCPKMRIILPVSKTIRDHSSTAEGKASMIAQSLSTPRESCRARMELSSLFQDSFLSTHRIKSPKYLPKVLGGCGCPPAFGQSDNTYLYIRAYRGGSYDRVYGTAMNEIKMAVTEFDSGQAPQLVLCKKLRDKQSYLHITFAEKVLLKHKPASVLSALGVGPPTPLYEAAGTKSVIQSMENRLVAARRLVTESQAEIERDRTARIQAVLSHAEGMIEFQRLQKIESSEARKRYEGALTGSAAAQRLMHRTGNTYDVSQLLTDEGFTYVGTGVLSCTREVTKWIVEGAVGETCTLQDIPLSETMYLREEVSLEETMKVGGILLQIPLNHRNTRVKETEARIGLYQISQSQEDWADTVVSELVSLRAERGKLGYQDVLPIMVSHREWVNDDSYIVAEVMNDTGQKPPSSVGLLSTDKKLARRIAVSTGNVVMLVNPFDALNRHRREFFRHEDFSVLAQEVMEELLIGFKNSCPAPLKVYPDSGSLSSAAMKMAAGITGEGAWKGTYYRKTLISTDKTVEGRMCVVKKELLDGAKPLRVELYHPNGNTVKVSAITTDTDAIPSRSKPGRFSFLRKRWTKR